ncbi:MAG: dihydrofolate reductase [Paramuribaculum sp.]|nr:dihydrofolate reductase [Paramuribaculum sp.]
MSTIVSIIAIVARDGAIGIRGDQPFHIADDFRRFKALTIGKPIVMGRRTFEALPKGALPGRRNIVITRQTDWTAPGAQRASSLDEAIALAADAEEIMIIGGGEVYRQAMPLATRLYLTEVDADVDGADTFFPALDPQQWTLAEISGYHTDPRSGARYRFAIYCRNSGI